MRLFLLPLTRSRQFLYCKRLDLSLASPSTSTSPSNTSPSSPSQPPTSTPPKPPLLDRLTSRAAKQWTKWESAEKGWQKKVTVWGNSLLDQISYQEWALKSLPPLSRQRKEEIALGRAQSVELWFPKSLVRKSTVLDEIKAKATSRQALHRKWLVWSIVGMPFTAPVALIPVIPNLPFFYLVFRAYSHWKALSGSRHLELLIQKDLVQPIESSELEELYARRQIQGETTNESRVEDKEVSLLVEGDGLRFAKSLDTPELEIELERARKQVDKDLVKDAEAKAEAEKKKE